jgi:hypothetical protein
MSATINAKTMTRILYSEKKADYNEWMAKTQAIADGGGYGETFRSPKKIIPTAEDLLLSTATAEDKKLFKDNASGVSLLTLSTTKISFGLVQKANGNAFDAVRLLNNKWAPSG